MRYAPLAESPHVEWSCGRASVNLLQRQEDGPPTLPSGLTTAIVTEWIERSLKAQNLTRDVRDAETIERVATIFAHALRGK